MRRTIRLALTALVVACGARPDSALFSDAPAADAQPSDPPPSVAPSGGSGGGAAPSPRPDGGSGALLAGGGATEQPAGGAPSAGTSGSGGQTSVAGTSSLGSAGEPAGAAGAAGADGAPEEPMVSPACGNGIIESGEQCDDGGLLSGDGCSATCKVVCADYGADPRMSTDYHCYVGFDEADFEGAQADCGARGGHLATIGSAAENALVAQVVRSSKWIGGFEDVSISSDAVGEYQWVTEEPWSYSKWRSGQPDRDAWRCGAVGSRCYEHCAAMAGDGTWSDASCDDVDGYVCEWPPAGS